MGNSCQSKTNLLAKNWIKINTTTFKNSITEQLINQYELSYQNEEQLIANNNLLMKRVNINHPNVVKIIYFYQNQEKLYCTNKLFRHKIYIEQYKELLFQYISDIVAHNKNMPNQCYCCPIVNGFSYLTEKYGFFHISEKMIYISSQFSWKKKQEKVMVKVWVNEKLQLNSPQKIIPQHQMCEQLIQLMKKMFNQGICCSSQIKNIPKIFHMQNLLNYVYNAHNKIHKKQIQTRKRIASTISSVNSFVPKVNLNTNSKQSLNLKNRSFSHYLNENKSMNALNISIQSQKKQIINNTPKKQYTEPIQPLSKFKHFHYVNNAYEKRKNLKVNFLYNNDDFSTPKQNYTQKFDNISVQNLQPKHFQLVNSNQKIQIIQNDQAKLQPNKQIQQNIASISQNNDKKIQQVVIVNNISSNISNQQSQKFISDTQLRIQLQQLIEQNQSNGIDYNKIYNKNDTKSYKNQTQRQNPQIIEQQNQNHSNQQEEYHKLSKKISNFDKQQQQNHLQQFNIKFNERSQNENFYISKQNNIPKIQIPKYSSYKKINQTQIYKQTQEQIEDKSINSEEQFKKSFQKNKIKDKRFNFIPSFGKPKQISSPRSFKSDNKVSKQKSNQMTSNLNYMQKNLENKYENYLKKFNKIVGNNNNHSSKQSSKNKQEQNFKDLHQTYQKSRIPMKKTQSSQQYQQSIYKSLQADKDSMKDKSNTKYSIGYKKQVQSLYNQSNASQEQAMKARLIQKIENTQKIIRQNRKKLEKIQLEKDLQREKQRIKSQIQPLLNNTLFSDESNLIKEKVKHKKATFAQLKAEAAKILQDLQI